MSLINEALRKARDEAAARERRGSVPPIFRSTHRPRRRRGVLFLAAGVAAVALLLAGAATTWWILGAGAATDRRDTLMEEMDAELEAPAPPTSPEPRAATGTLGETQPPAQPAVPLAEPIPAPTAPGASGARGAEPRSPDPISAQRDATPDPGTGERSYRARAELGYASLVLDYLVYRPSDPFAQINGAEVHEGSVIEGFTVEEITRDHVRLRDERGPLLLRVR